MSKYTTQLRWPVEQCEAASKSSLTEGQQFHSETYARLGLNDYPIFNEDYRKELNDRIIRHYYFREIGFETLQLFAWYMRAKMFEIMPYYNQLYKSTLYEIDPLADIDMRYTEVWDVVGTDDTTDMGELSRDTTGSDAETHTETSITDTNNTRDTKDVTTDNRKTTTDNTGTSNDVSQENTRNVFQDTPMSLLSNTESPTVGGMDYATNVTYTDTTGDNTGKTTSNTVTSVEGDLTVTGNIGDAGNSTTNVNGSSDRTTSNNVKEGTRAVKDNDTTEKGTRDKTEKGHRSNLSDLLLKYRSTFINVDVMIINDIADMFMGIY